MIEETFFERVVVHTVGQVAVHSIKKIITFFKFTPSEAALSRFAERPGERVPAFFVMMKMLPPLCPSHPLHPWRQSKRERKT